MLHPGGELLWPARQSLQRRNQDMPQSDGPLRDLGPATVDQDVLLDLGVWTKTLDPLPLLAQLCFEGAQLSKDADHLCYWLLFEHDLGRHALPTS